MRQYVLHLLANPSKVQSHQANFVQIQKLRAAVKAQDTQVRDTITSLASTRKDVVSTQANGAPLKPRYEIKYDELLSYARRISKTTLPPASVLSSLAATDSDMNGSQAQTRQSQTQQAHPGTPILTQGSTLAASGSQLPSEMPTQTTMASTNTTLPEGLTYHLNPYKGIMFFPWPDEYKIRMGALAANQLLEEQGIDPKDYDPVLEEEKRQEAEEERRRQQEKERLERVEKERRMREDMERRNREKQKQLEEMRRRSSVALGGPSSGDPASSTARPKDKKQFQFTSIEDLDDDE